MMTIYLGKYTIGYCITIKYSIFCNDIGVIYRYWIIIEGYFLIQIKISW